MTEKTLSEKEMKDQDFKEKKYTERRQNIQSAIDGIERKLQKNNTDKIKLSLLKERLAINKDSIRKLNLYKNKLIEVEKSKQLTLLDSQISVLRKEMIIKSEKEKRLKQENKSLGIQVNNLAAYINKLTENLSNIKIKNPNVFPQKITEIGDVFGESEKEDINVTNPLFQNQKKK